MENYNFTLEHLSCLSGGKNLLAFSGGVDSTALYFLLKEARIHFDIAIVDYKIRTQSSLEISRAKQLAFFDNKKCFIYEAPKIEQNFEANARAVRYEFFNTLIQKYEYKNLILAHQLDDLLEWFMMQLSKGTDVLNTLIPSLTKRNYQNKNYYIVRPLLYITKANLIKYLEKNTRFYFEDYSNNYLFYKRNYFRKNFTQKLLEEFHLGIAFSLKLMGEKTSLEEPEDLGGYFCFESSKEDFIFVDKASKKLGYLLSKSQKFQLQNLLEKEEFSYIFGDKIVIEKCNKKLYIFPNLREKQSLNKEEKEFFRKAKIPKRFRVFHKAFKLHLP
ncbi:tRNA lysidine(34) synthetase TilS [Helicobacter burdigaliensis]|uniref:tRNA lysidine(34) synthetase TilS n=1 Tax=Helicobacter burdigaliensis TaxID=2315334 RepID=UPI000EF72EE4|nr:tRNA lysidine(34) synthetase TilS [Helicobacter burdigaliensis]